MEYCFSSVQNQAWIHWRLKYFFVARLILKGSGNYFLKRPTGTALTTTTMTSTMSSTTMLTMTMATTFGLREVCCWLFKNFLIFCFRFSRRFWARRRHRRRRQRRYITRHRKGGTLKTSSFINHRSLTPELLSVSFFFSLPHALSHSNTHSLTLTPTLWAKRERI